MIYMNMIQFYASNYPKYVFGVPERLHKEDSGSNRGGSLEEKLIEFLRL